MPRDRKPVRRLSTGKLLLGFLLLLLGGGGAFALIQLDPEQYVRLESVRVEGAEAVDEDEMLRLAGLEPGLSLLRIDKAEVVRRLQSDPRVERAQVLLDWPRRVVLRIGERVPLAIVVGYGFLDASGHHWDMDRRAGRLDLPLVTGVDGLAAEQRPAHLAEAASLLVQTAAILPKHPISQLELGEDGPVLYFEGGPGPVRMGYQRYGEKLDRLGRLLTAQPGVQAHPMDLRWQGRVIVSGVNGERGQEPS